MLQSRPRTEPARWVRLYGERCSGTNYVRALIEQNLPSLAFGNTYNWEKHDFVNPGFVRPDEIGLVVIRDAMTWMQSLHRNPHQVGQWYRQLDFSGFLRHEWSSVINTELFGGQAALDIRGQELMSDRHPQHGGRIANVVELRNLKIRSQMKVCDLFPTWAILRYEEARDRPEEVLDQLAALSGLARSPSFTPVTADMAMLSGAGRRHLPYAEFAPADLQFVAATLDLRQERALGFHYPGLESATPAIPLRSAPAQAKATKVASRPAKQKDRPAVCLVTAELAFDGESGETGAAFADLAEILAQSCAVTVLYCPHPRPAEERLKQLSDTLAGRNIRLVLLEAADDGRIPDGPTTASYAVFRFLAEASPAFDVVHFHDHKALGFHSLKARDQGLAFAATRMAVHLHGSSRWMLERSGGLFTDQAQLMIDFMERDCIAKADLLISPGRYMLDWLEAQGWPMPPETQRRVIPNGFGSLAAGLSQANPADAAAQPVSEIICFARHEDHKGLVVFADALDLLAEELAQARITVTFLGAFGRVQDEHSGVWLAMRGRRWAFPLRILPHHDREQAARYMADAGGAVVVVPSQVENAPYAVLEPALLGRPVIVSATGGAADLLAPDLREEMVIEMKAAALAARLRLAIERGMPPARPANEAETIATEWEHLHHNLPPAHRPPARPVGHRPKVSLCITHYNRFDKLADAIASAHAQTWPELELIVVDDGSPGEASRRRLEELRPMIEGRGGKLVCRENGYLGAARNSGAAAATGEYLCFLDDDDVALPEMIESLVTSALHSGADIVTCNHYYMPEAERATILTAPGEHRAPLDHPLGGPLSLAPMVNVFGPPTALISRAAFDRVGGYTELRNVGHEDMEFFMRAAQAGLRIELCPLPLYLYEVGRPSMISTTPVTANFARVVNAIDVALQPEAWHDLLRLDSGRAATLARQTRHRQLRESGFRHPLADAVERAVTPGQEMDTLAELAAEIGSPRMAQAFSEAALDLRNGGSLRVWAAKGRGTAADDPMQRIHALLPADTIPQDEAEKLIHAVLITETPPTEAESRLPALFAFAYRSGMTGHAAKFLSQLAQMGEAEYAAQYPDIAEAIRTGKIASGWQHFLRHGQSEGRTGFAAAMQAQHLVNHLGKTRLTLVELAKKSGK